MSLRNLSNFSSSLPSQPTASPMSLGGGKGMAGSQRPQANPQSQMLQQLMQMMMARRQSGMQNPGFMSPLQRMGGVVPQLPSQAAPQAVQAVQGNTPGMQAQQAAAAMQAQQESQRAAAPAPVAPQWTYMKDVPYDYMQKYGVRDFFTWDPAKQMWRGKDNTFYQSNPTDTGYGD